MQQIGETAGAKAIQHQIDHTPRRGCADPVQPGPVRFKNIGFQMNQMLSTLMAPISAGK